MENHYLSERATLEDVQCLELARLGFTYEAISHATGLTKSQIGYRLKMSGIHASEYRRGESELAKKVIELASIESRKYFDMLVSNIRKYLKE